MKLSNLLDKELHITEKKRIWFIIPAGIIAFALILMLIFGLTGNGALNIGMDFSGGYTMDVKLGTMLTNDNRSAYEKRITSVVENLTDENGNKYGLKVSGIQSQNSGVDASLYVKYKAVDTEERMEEVVNPAIKNALQDSIFKRIPAVTANDAKTEFTVTYTEPLVEPIYTAVCTAVTTQLSTASITADFGAFSALENKKTFSFTTSAALSDELVGALPDALTFDDRYSGLVSDGSLVSATVTGELLTTAIAACVLAIVLMLAYIAIRFELTSGLAAIVALFHDIIIMFCFMAIFHIEINSTFIAALITILGYSINNTIIIFDRVRETLKSEAGKTMTGAQIANRAVGDTLLRSLNTTLTTLITIGMVAIIGVPDIRVFALPIIAGLLAGTFSSICIAPSIWAMIRDRKKRKPKTVAKPQNDSKASVTE